MKHIILAPKDLIFVRLIFAVLMLTSGPVSAQQAAPAGDAENG